MEDKETSEKHVFRLTLLHCGHSDGFESQQRLEGVGSWGDISSIRIVINVPRTPIRGAAHEI